MEKLLALECAILIKKQLQSFFNLLKEDFNYLICKINLTNLIGLVKIAIQKIQIKKKFVKYAVKRDLDHK